MVYPFGYPAPPLEHCAKLFVILSRYFRLIEDGKAGKVRPKPVYLWRYYKGEMTMERMLAAIQGLDQYIVNQIEWVNSHRAHGTEPYTAGPEYAEMPHNALVAMFQEIDKMFADLGYEQEPRADEC